MRLVYKSKIEQVDVDTLQDKPPYVTTNKDIYKLIQIKFYTGCYVLISYRYVHITIIMENSS